MSNPATGISLEGRPAWPTLFFVRQWPEQAVIGPEIVQHLVEARQRQASNVASGVAVSAKSGEGLYESDFDLFDLPHAGLRRLRAFIVESLRVAISQVNGGEVHPRRIEIEIPDSWFHITNDGGFHDTHAHHGCSWCGIFCLQAGECGGAPGEGAGNGINRFYSPIPVGGGYRDYGNAYLSADRIDVCPKNGQLVLFPSYLLHSALPYRGKTDRVVIAFNSRAFLSAGVAET